MKINQAFISYLKFLLLCGYRAIWIYPIRCKKLKVVRNYRDLYNVALWEIKQLSVFGKVCMISAPLFSGGTGNFCKNLDILKRYYRMISKEGEIIWNQIPYLDVKVQKWAKCIELNTSKKIQHFYVPLIQSNEIKKLITIAGIIPNIPDYADSIGCETERKAAIEAGVEIMGRIFLSLHL